jgi:four helix bundle protein
MPTFRSIEDIEAWQRARALTREIYRTSNVGRFAKDFGLRDQIQRAAVSIMSNIAEGFERSGSGEFAQFLSIAKGSTGEVRSQLYVALDQEYVTQAEFERLIAGVNETARMISGLMSYLRGSAIKGVKYRAGRKPQT